MGFVDAGTLAAGCPMPYYQPGQPHPGNVRAKADTGYNTHNLCANSFIGAADSAAGGPERFRRYLNGTVCNIIHLCLVSYLNAVSSDGRVVRIERLWRNL